MKSLWYRTPAFVCALICFGALLGSLSKAEWWKPLLLAFLPACFFLVGSMMAKQGRELSRLRRRMSRLEEKLHVRPSREETELHHAGAEEG